MNFLSQSVSGCSNECVEAIVGMCRVGGVSSAKTIIKGLKETGFSTNDSL